MVFGDESAHHQNQDEIYQREIREHYATLINRIPVGVYLVVSSPDGSLRFDFVSPKFCEIYNMPEERFLEDPSLAFNLTHPEDYQNLLAANSYAVENGEPFSWEGRFVVDGRVKWVEISSEPNRLSNGDVLWSGMVKETTERKLAEAKVLAERAQAQQYLDIAAVMIVALDRQGNISLINSKGCKILGYEEAEIIGANWFDLCVPAEIRESVRAVFHQIMAGDITTVEFYENELKTSSGELVTLNFHNSMIVDEFGNISGILSSGENITEQRRLELQFNQAQKMEAIGTLVGGIAHDFNNMLAGITGNIFLAKHSAQGLSEVEQKLSRVEELTFRAADMIQQLLTFARKGDVVKKPLLLSPFLKETLKFLRTTTPENIQLNLESSHTPMTINGDVTQLHQVLMNLVNNARDALEGFENPAINILLEAQQLESGAALLKKHPDAEPGAYAHLSVADNGCSIPEEAVPHLFEPFYTTKKEGEGTGLGLAMVFGAVKTHNGFIEVESSAGRGSVFHLYLPLQEEAAAIKTTTEDSVSRGHGEKILVVDDDADVRRSSKEILESMAYEVLQAADGEEAVKLFSSNQQEINLILIDVVMPKLGGVEAIAQIREIRPDIKVIFATGYDKEQALKGKSLGRDIVLSKPYDIKRLSHAIDKLLNS